MPVATLTAIPSRIVAGNTLILRLGFSDFSAVTWTGDLILSRNGSALKIFRATASGTEFLWTLAPADTISLPPGAAVASFKFTEIATSQVDSLSGASILIAPNPAGTLAETEKQAALRTAKLALKKIADSAAGMTGIMNTQTVLRALNIQRAEVDRLQNEVDIELSQMGIKSRTGLSSVSVL